eukprot:UN11249
MHLTVKDDDFYCLIIDYNCHRGLLYYLVLIYNVEHCFCFLFNLFS